jgi:pilus assembly protein CpaE
VRQVEAGRGGTKVVERSRPTIDRRVVGSVTHPHHVVVGIRDLGLHQEVLDFLERDPRVRIGAAVQDEVGLARALDDGDLEAVIVCPDLARALRPTSPIAGRSPAFVVVSEEMTVPVLRDAVEIGARGVFAWPDERSELVEFLALVPAADARTEGTRGTVVAVFGARGGAGSTFLASHLAAAMSDRGLRVVVVDLDVAFAGLTVSLGLAPDEEPHTLADLVPVMEELSPDHVTEALVRHPRGFDALLSPPARDLRGVAPVTPGLVRASVALLAADHDAVVLHAPRALDTVASAGVRIADRVLLVTTQDLFSLYGAKRALWQFELDRPPERCRVVLNRFSRGHLPPADVGRILGVRPWATVRFDPAVRRAQDLGRLLPPRARRAGRDVRDLARRLVPTGAPGALSPEPATGEE